MGQRSRRDGGIQVLEADPGWCEFKREVHEKKKGERKVRGTFQERLKDVAGSPQLRMKGAQKGPAGGWDGAVEEDQGGGGAKGI